MTLIRTKFMVARNLPGTIDRSRLHGLLEAAVQPRLTIVSAPAGYGKSTLLRQWYWQLKNAGIVAGWLSLDAKDRNPSRLLVYIVEMLAAAAPTAGAHLRTVANLDNLAPVEAIMAAILECILEITEPVYLIFDDLHLLDSDTVGMIFDLISCGPSNLSVVVASREVPELPLGRLRAQGQLHELGIDDLRFTEAEIADFLAKNGFERSGPEMAPLLLERTEGWVTGLKLATMTLLESPGAIAQVKSFSGERRSLADYFTEDVMSGQNAGLQEFLLETSVLDRFCPELCDAVTGRSDSREMIEAIELAGLFLIPLDDERRWYRYHNLFSEFLRRRLRALDPNAPVDLHRRASSWFAENDLICEACEHSVQARDHQGLAELLEGHAEDMTYAGQLPLLVKYAKELPDHVLAQFPHIMLAQAWYWTRRLRFTEVRRCLERARSRIDQMKDDCPPARVASLNRLYRHREIMLASAEDQVVKVDEECGNLIKDVSSDSPYITCTLYAQMIIAKTEQYKFQDLEVIEAKARGELERSEYPFAGINLNSVIGSALFSAGKVQAAESALINGLDRAKRFGGEGSGLPALAALPLALIYYQWNRLDEAAALVEEHLPAAREFGFVDQLKAGYLVQIRLKAATGDIEGALAVLHDGLNVAIDSGLERLKLHMIVEKIRLLALAGHQDQIIDCAATVGVQGTTEKIIPRSSTVTQDELRAMIWTRTRIVQGALPDALAVAKHWRTFCNRRGAVLSDVRWGLLIAEIASMMGEEFVARRALGDALAAGAPCGIVRTFVDPGESIRTLLEESFAATPLRPDPLQKFAQQVINAFDSKSRNTAPEQQQDLEERRLYGRLNRRELEILKLVRSGLRNREIGNRLGLTEGTVKWYMQQIYDKTGTRRRPQAVDRAHQFGLLN